MDISYENSQNFRGYMKLGVKNTGGQMDWREQVEWAAEDASVMGRMRPLLLAKPVSAPAGNESGAFPYDIMKGSVQARILGLKSYLFFEKRHYTRRIAECLRKALCLALDLDEDYLTPLFYTDDDQTHWAIKLVSFPPLPKSSNITIST